MNIIIAGAGKVGSTLAEQLAVKEHNVTIIDRSEDILHRLSRQLDVMCIKGNCATQNILREAGVSDAHIVIAATDSDEINLLCCHCAHRMGTSYTVARVRGKEYTADVDTLKRDLGINLIINPESATAVEISRLLRFPSVDHVDTFARGQVELVSFRVQEQDFLHGRALASLSAKIRSLPILFCAVERGDQVVIPNGHFILSTGDKVHMAGTPSGIHQFFKVLGRSIQAVHTVFIIGGGRITHYLLEVLGHFGMRCKVVEKDEDCCRRLAEDFPQAIIIHGDGTDSQLLTEERMEASDAFIALTNRDEDNLIISLYAHQKGVSKVVAKSNRPNYTGIARSAGVESVVSPKLTTANQILRVVRGIQSSKGSVMTALYRIADGNAEAMEFLVGPDTHHLGTPLKDLRLKPGVLIAVIVRRGKIIIPEGSTALKEGDSVIVVAKDSGIMELNSIYLDSSRLGGIS